MTTRLDDRLFPTIDYTRRDQIITDLMGIITCPIVKEVADDPVVFNLQFYDRESFDTFRSHEDARSQRAINSGMNDFSRVFFKDPRTGKNYKPTYAKRTLFLGRPTRSHIITILFKRIENINIDEIDEILPAYNTSDTQVEYLKAFVTTTKALFDSRATSHKAYTEHIATLQQAALLANEPNPSPLQSSRSQSPSHTRRMHGEPVIDVDSISSDSEGSGNGVESILNPEDDATLERIINGGGPDDTTSEDESTTPATAHTPSPATTTARPTAPVLPVQNVAHPPSLVTTTARPTAPVLPVQNVAPPPSPETTTARPPAPLLPVQNVPAPPSPATTVRPTVPVPTNAIPSPQRSARPPTVNVLTQDSTTDNDTLPPPAMNVNRMLRATSRQRRLPVVPSMTEGMGAEACVTILHLAKADGWAVSIGHRYRIKWFEAKHEMLFADGGPLCMYKQCCTLSVRRKFNAAENTAKSLFQRRGHQPSHSAYLDENTLPLYCRLFFEYFTFAEERSTSSSAVRAQRWRNVRVNRSVIGQQPAVSATNEIELNSTVAPQNRERGTGEVAGEVTINEISQGASSESNNDFSEGSSDNNRRQTFTGHSTPRRRHAPNDGRASRATRSRTYNVANYPDLPTSTGGIVQ